MIHALCSFVVFLFSFFFFFNDTATTEIYTLSLHDALPIFQNFTGLPGTVEYSPVDTDVFRPRTSPSAERKPLRSEEYTSELQSRRDLVCRLLLEKKKNKNKQNTIYS